MKTLSLLLVLATCLFSSAPAFCAESKPLPDEVKATATAWLQLLDKGQFSESWKQAATRFRSFFSEKDWNQRMGKMRTPLGGAISRELSSSVNTNTRPGMPPGNYWVLEFSTKFEKMPSAIEEVTLIPDKDSSFRVFALAIRPAS